MRRYRGIALISVLMITVVVSALAYHLVSRHTMTIAATRVHFETSRIREFNLATELLATEELRADWQDEQSRTFDSWTERWASPFTVSFEEGDLHFVIIDSLSKFNLNSASRQGDAVARQTIASLFEKLELPPNTNSLWNDWIDGDLEPSQGGAEDFNWLVNSPPMRTPNQPVTDLTEVRTLAELTRDQFAALRQLATILPTNDVKVNINTVIPEVLEAMDQTLSPSMIGQLPDMTREYRSVDEAVGSLPELARLANRLVVKTSFFEVQSTITIGGRRSDYICYLHRDSETGEVRVYERDFGMKVEPQPLP